MIVTVFLWIFMRCYDCGFLWREACLSTGRREVRPDLSGICIECGSLSSFERGRSKPGPQGTAAAAAPPLTNRGGTSLKPRSRYARSRYVPNY